MSGLFEVAKKTELLKEITKKKIFLDDLRKDYSKMDEIASIVGERGAQDRDEHEIFISLFITLNFYEIDSDVCFEVHNFNPNKDKITTLEDLMICRERIGTSDFLIKSKNGFRKFQLKRYRGELNTQDFFDFIKGKITHYGNDLGDTNLLLVLQSPQDYVVSAIDFHKLYEKLRSLNLKFQGEILILYNNNNKERVIICVHPKLASTKRPI